MTIKLFNIEFETDGEKVDLPSEIVCTPEDMGYDESEDGDIESFIDERGADHISDTTGWLVNGFDYEITH
jgi:hypothetical protein